MGELTALHLRRSLPQALLYSWLCDFHCSSSAACFGELDTGDPHRESWYKSDDTHARGHWRKRYYNWLDNAKCKWTIWRQPAICLLLSAGNTEMGSGAWSDILCLISICLVEWSHKPNALVAGEKGCRKGNSTCSKWM